MLDLPAMGIDDSLHIFLSNGVKQVGLGIQHPVETAPHVHAASKITHSYLVCALVEGGCFDTGNYCRNVKEACQYARKVRLQRENDILAKLGHNNTATE